MSVKVLIPTPLRPHAGGTAAVEFQANTVDEALQHLTTQFADLKRHLFTEEGKLRSFVNVYLNGEDIRYLAQGNTATKDGDTINIIPSIAGGAAACSANPKHRDLHAANRNFSLARIFRAMYTGDMLSYIAMMTRHCCGCSCLTGGVGRQRE